MTIAGVLRDEIFSPNSNDLRIMQLVSENLQGQGRTILLYTEKEFLRNDIHAHIVFSMARHTATLDKLQVIEPDAKRREEYLAAYAAWKKTLESKLK